MNGFRVGLVLLLVIVFGIPAVLPFGVVFTHEGYEAWADLGRLGRLAQTTASLVGGVLILALPLGVGQALLLFRTNLPLRRVFLLINLLLLALPLPLHVMGWQAFLGPDGWVALWTNAPGRPWIEGLTPAILIHAAAAIPWVVVIVGASLQNVERELEEEALLTGGPWHVLWWATLPRCRGAILAAGCWVVLQTMNEVAVTEMLQVNTFAEEIRMRFVLGGGPNQTRALVLTLPVILAIWFLLVRLRPTLERSLFSVQNDAARPRRFDLGDWRWLFLALVGGWLLLVFFGPTVGLVERLGRTGYPSTWNGEYALERGEVVLRLRGLTLAWTLGAAVAAGFLAAALALTVSWAMLDSPRCQTICWSLAALCWALPAPAAGLGLKEFISLLIDVWPNSPLETILYREGPTPIIWAHLLRFFPCALAILWPIVRMTAPELRDAARLVGPLGELRLAVWPSARAAFWTALLAVTVLALSEVGAASLVANPGWDTFAKLLFDAMHTGLDNDVAAQGLWLMAMVFVLGAVWWLAASIFPSRVR